MFPKPDRSPNPMPPSLQVTGYLMMGALTPNCKKHSGGSRGGGFVGGWVLRVAEQGGMIETVG